MRVLIQRVSRASVTVDEAVVGAIDGGYLLLVGVTHNDGAETVDAMAVKVVQLRLFEDAAGQINLSLLDILASDPGNAGVLVVSQFTLYASTKKGRRPSFTEAARPDHARPLIEDFCERLREKGLRVETGVFGAHM
ncbi:MAG: D-tyrosyl-tRNA(Tyr) deacylase, partial [Rhizobiales bacterium]|nr:D-tyrosyl-tRNA(Tyr) deacylase [Hyphomicrobiales bacterium]